MIRNCHTRSTLAALAILATPLLLWPAPPALARTKTLKDDVRGFECRVEDSWEQVPPKPGTDDLHVAAEWKDPSPKYQRFSGDQPTLRLIWTVTPKGGAPAAEAPLPAWAEDLPPELQERVRQMASGTKETLEGEVNGILQRAEYLFGPYKSLAERWAEEKRPKTVKSASGNEFRTLEVNYSKKRPKEGDATWWLWLAQTGWETETETIEVGFYGYVDVGFASDFRKQFEATVRSFKLREIKDASEAVDKFADAVREQDPPEVREKIVEFLRTKLPKDWRYERTDHYLVIYDMDVDSKRIVDRVTKEIEALRTQVYEVLFPPDRPVTAVSIVRVCDSRDQYLGYGAPGGSAGYWSPYHEELVLYQDRNDKKDAIRVLYHEAFHQYIYYSVGEVSPHSWFNEGHGDFFSGHVYDKGKFRRAPFDWRTESAREWKSKWKEGIPRKRLPGSRPRPGEDRGEDESGGGTTADTSAPVVGDRLTLREWLTWSQGQYYGSNDWGIPGGINYALGWSFIYFLRTTKNEAYQQILPRYFNTLKGFVTQDREAQERAREAGFGGPQPGEPEPGGEPPPDGGDPPPDGPPPGAGGPEAGGSEPTPPATPGGTTDTVSRGQWHGEALRQALSGIDLDQLEKDWLESSW